MARQQSVTGILRDIATIKGSSLSDELKTKFVKHKEAELEALANMLPGEQTPPPPPGKPAAKGG